jgi:hypothetical protein
MALTAKQDYNTVGATKQGSIKAAGNDTYYKGAMLVQNADGYADVPSDAANLRPIGVYTGRAEDGVVDNSYEVANGSHPRLVWESGRIWIPHTGAAQTDVGELFYLSDDSTLTQTAGSKTWVVPAVDFRTGYLLIDFDAAEQA